jgi:hypothetical protein
MVRRTRQRGFPLSVKVAVKGGGYESEGNLEVRGFCFATVIFTGLGEMNATEP